MKETNYGGISGCVEKKLVYEYISDTGVGLITLNPVKSCSDKFQDWPGNIAGSWLAAQEKAYHGVI